MEACKYATQKKGVVNDCPSYQRMKGLESPSMHHNNSVADDI